MKKSKKIILCIAIVLLAIISVALGMFQGEARTLLSVKENGDTGIYEVNYAADYKLDELLEAGGAATEEQLVQYILKTMLKGLPIEVPYEIPNLACSTFYAETPENGYIFGRKHLFKISNHTSTAQHKLYRIIISQFRQLFNTMFKTAR